MSVLEEKRSHLWRLSDFLCTYRFWVIANFLIALYGLKFLIWPQVIAIMRDNYLTADLIGIYALILNLSTIIGITVAWLISRSKSVYSLCVLGIIAILCLVIIQLSNNLMIYMVCAFILYMLSIIALLLSAAYIAQAAKKASTFILLFGFIYVFMNATPTSISFYQQAQRLSYHDMAITAIISILIATILLACSHKNIFYTLPQRASQHNNIDESSLKWTWANLISSYRFWGLFIFFIFTTSGTYYIKHYLPIYYITELSLNISIIQSLNYIPILAGLVAIPVALIAYLVNKYWSLFIFGLLLIFAITLSNCHNYSMLFFASFLYQCMSYALFLVLFASIAKVINSVPEFVAVYSIFIFWNYLQNMIDPVVFSSIMYGFSNKLFHIDSLTFINNLFIFFIILGYIFLAFVNPKLFDESTNNPPSAFSVTITFIITCMPFLSLFWYARVHNLIRSYSHSPKLLTPTGAVLCVLFVPFSSLFILTILYDVTNEITENKTKTGWGFILLSIFFPPAAAAILQTRLNKFYYQNMKVSD